jgi:hypothetical protein
MVLIRRFPDGFEVHGGKLTKEEEADLYRRMAGGPMRILRSRPVLPETAIEKPDVPPDSDIAKRRP